MTKIGPREVGAPAKFYCYVYNFIEESLAADEINVAVTFSQLKSHLPLLIVRINIFSLIFFALTGYITSIKLLLA